MSLWDIKTELVNEAHKLEAKIEGVFESAKEEPAKVVEAVSTDVSIEAASVQSVIEARVAAVEGLIDDKFKALEERIADFNKRSGQKL